MQKLQIGDVVRTIVNIDMGGRKIFVGAIDEVIVVYTQDNGFWYNLENFPGVQFEEVELELVTTSFAEVATNSNPNLSKRVSKKRDELLKGIFGS